MNNFIEGKISKQLSELPPNLQKILVAEAEFASNLGVGSEEDYKDFFYISLHAGKIAEELTGERLQPEQKEKIIAEVYQNKDKLEIGSIYQMYVAVGEASKQLGLPIKKMAYPQGETGSLLQQTYDRGKWLLAMREIYARMYTGLNKEQALEVITGTWAPYEKRDFRNWLAFYEQKGHQVYKLANGKNFWEVGNGAYLPLDVNSLRATLPTPGIPNAEEVQREIALEKQKKELEQQKKLTVKEELEKNVRALISRLNSAERIATSKGIDKILGHDGLKQWLQALHALKREIQVVPMSIATVQDLIVKQANILSHSDNTQGAALLYKVAQMPEPPAITEEAPPADLVPVPMSQEEDADEAMEEFVKNMKGKTDESNSDDLEVSEDDLKVVAQVMPPATPPPETVPEAAPTDLAPPATEEMVPTPEEEAGVKPVGEAIQDQTDHLEEALKNVTTLDIINKLESVAYMFKNRELARQLLLADLMMHQLGIASFFPSLGEAIKSALDSNAYVLTRVEDILGRLRGSIPAEKMDLTAPPPAGTPDVEALKQNLNQQDQQEQDRRERRKVIEDATEKQKLERAQQVQPPAPEGLPTAPEELAGPATVEAPPTPPIPPRT